MYADIGTLYLQKESTGLNASLSEPGAMKSLSDCFTWSLNWKQWNVLNKDLF